MKKIRSLILVLLLVLALQNSFVYAVPATDSCMTLDAKIALAGNSQLLPTAQAVVLYAPDSDTMLYSWNADQELDPSGMNKIMTALLALESGELEAMVSVTSTALNSVEIGAMSAGLRAGESLTLRDLLYLMMVGSANDAAAVIAEHISGSQAAFVTSMNQRAKELGCTKTYFLNPTGLSAEGQYTTARDLAKITAKALKMEAFVELFSAVEYTVPASDTTREHGPSRIVPVEGHRGMHMKIKHGFVPPKIGEMPWAMPPWFRFLPLSATGSSPRGQPPAQSSLSDPSGCG